MAALAIASRSLSRELAVGGSGRAVHAQGLREVPVAVGG
jgi:hypothetical protein